MFGSVVDRREMLFQSATGFGGLALGQLLRRDGRSLAGEVGVNPLAPKEPDHDPKAKACIFLFMSGGPSQIDLFDYKPALEKYQGQTLPESFETPETQFIRKSDVLMAPKRKFRRHGESGMYVSEFLPHTAKIVDEIGMIHSCHCDSFIHESAQYQLASGRVIAGYPSIGSWVTYGLGSEADSLPAYVALLSKHGANEGGTPCWSSGFLPVVYGGTAFRKGKSPILDLTRPEAISERRYRNTIEAITKLNQETSSPEDEELAARIASYELAYKMQSAAPEVVDLTEETKETLEAYGVGQEETDDFGSRCLLARRLVERGVRFVTVFAGGGVPDVTQWDAHNSIEKNHGRMCKITDQPAAALINDLKQRGMLEETLVVWGGEFGRTPLAEGKGGGKGRDHNPGGYSMWMAGGGVKGGTVVGSTDEIGLNAVENKCHVHAVHATILNQMGIDFESQEFLHNGRFERLTDVGGRLIEELV